MKKFISIPITFILFFFFGKNSKAQELPFFIYPADHYIIQKLISEDESLYNSYVQYEEQLKQFQEDISGFRTDTLIDGKRIIPVVFHILHKVGAENISDAQIYDAMELLNIDYNLQNADTANTYYLFKDRAADCKIEFRLAKIDPLGNCTDGINRYYDPMTNYAYFEVMRKYAWSPSRYLNIFSVNFIYPEGMILPEGALIGGMSPFAPSNPLTIALTGGDTLCDGIIIRHDCLGSIGTAQNLAGMPINQQNRVLVHESGHYFNLYHTFHNMMLGLIPAASGCHTWLAPNGDEVDDTPQTAGANMNTGLNCIIPGSVNSCIDDPEPDMVENYMDYQWGYCQNIFTLGQYNRKNTTLMGDRRNLWSYENLVYTGVLDTNTYLCAPVADFYADKYMLCAGGTVQFSDYSWSGQADTYEWTFQGGTPSSSTEVNPLVTYNTPGIFNVTLKLTNTSGSDTLTKQNLIRVFDPTVSYSTPATESFETININEFVIYNDTGSTWQITSTAAYTGSKSLYLKNFQGNVPGSVTEIITPAYDFTDFNPTPPTSLKFKLAYAGKYIPATLLTPADTAYDQLKVFVSKDCGATWTQKYNKKAQQLETSAPVQTEFIPSSQNQWREEMILLTGAPGVIGEQNIKFKFQFFSNGGNNIYIDDLYIDYYNANIENYENFHNITIGPNPAKDEVFISFILTAPQTVAVELYDITGRKISKSDAGNLQTGKHSIIINISDILSDGLYLLHIKIGTDRTMKKLNVVR